MYNRRNTWQGEGNLTKDPEIHTTPNGLEVVHFSLAVSGAGTGTGERDSAGFFDCKIWLTENEYTCVSDVAAARDGFKTGRWGKGAKLFVIGRLLQERWQKEGESARSRVIIMADRVEELYVRPADGATGTPQRQQNAEVTPANGGYTNPGRTQVPDSF